MSLNQCDPCRRGIPREHDGGGFVHFREDGSTMAICSKDRYEDKPISQETARELLEACKEAVEALAYHRLAHEMPSYPETILVKAIIKAEKES